MRKIIALVIFFMMTSVYSIEVGYRLDPKNPVAGEPFNLVLEIETDSDEDPFISFDPGNVEVIGRSSEGQSISTTIINGRVTTKKTVNYVYELQAPRSGKYYLRDFVVEVGKQKKNVGNLSFSVISGQVRSKKVFLKAISEKDDLWRGEGTKLTYYLYTKINIQGQEIVTFPKLSNFMKRFIDVSRVNPVTVNHNGEVYYRYPVYSAVVFPTKSGKVKAESLKLRIRYMANRNSFGNFGFSFGRPRSMTLTSKPVFLEVRDLPATGVPSSFTGLVGDHDFSLSINKNKFLVNEPIELKLDVEGTGLLEQYDAPSLYNNPNLEEFDSKASFKEDKSGRARKSFQLTLLPRNAFEEKEKTFKFSYFDPQTEKYIEKEVQVPAIKVLGGTVAIKSSPSPAESVRSDGEGENKVQVVAKRPIVKSIVAPIFDNGAIQMLKTSKYMWANIVLLILILMTLFSFAPRGKKKDKIDFSSLYKKNVSFEDIFHALTPYFDKDRKNFFEKIQNLDLQNDEKSYLISYIEYFEKKKYAPNMTEGNKAPIVKKQVFKNFAKAVEQYENNKFIN